MSNDNSIKEKSKEEIIKENISCSCRDVYKEREMPDPHCFYHEHLYTLEAMLEEYAEIRAVAFAEWLEKNASIGTRSTAIGSLCPMILYMKNGRYSAKMTKNYTPYSSKRQKINNHEQSAEEEGKSTRTAGCPACLRICLSRRCSRSCILKRAE